MEYLKSYMLGQNSLLDWLISLIIVVGVLVTGKLIYLFSSKVLLKATSKTKTKLDDILVKMLEAPFILGIFLLGFWIAVQRLEFGTEKVHNMINSIYDVLVVVNATWFISRFIDAVIREYIFPSTEKAGSKLDKHVVSVIKKTASMLIWLVGIILALHSAGVNVATLIAGLGIGGIAFALAAQDTIKNLLGGITIFIDRPFRIGDRVKIGTTDGNIADIGLRSLKIRTLTGRLVTMPNYKVVDSELENITSEPSRKVELDLGVTYNTSLEKMEKAMTLLREIPLRIPEVQKDVQAAFVQFQDSALQLKCIYYIRKQADVLETQTNVNMDILRTFNENNIEFAYPTQTIFVEK